MLFIVISHSHNSFFSSTSMSFTHSLFVCSLLFLRPLPRRLRSQFMAGQSLYFKHINIHCFSRLVSSGAPALPCSIVFVEGMYHACPWLVVRPVYLLATNSSFPEVLGLSRHFFLVRSRHRSALPPAFGLSPPLCVCRAVLCCAVRVPSLY